MKIRKKITIWIAGTALIATVSFSLFIVIELVEQHFILIDKELQNMATAIVEANTSATVGEPLISLSALPYNSDNYWIKITDKNNHLLYKSAMTNFVDLSSSNNNDKYSIEKNIPRDQIWLGQDKKDDVLFRVRRIQSSINFTQVVIVIAVPIEDIEEEYITLLQEYGVGFLLCALLIILISYILARRILQPVAFIYSMAKEISEESLDQRIPLSKSKDEFYDLSVALNRMFDRLQHSFAKQKEFIGNASHELKSPLTLLKISQEELLMNYELSKPIKNNLERQLKTTHRMNKLFRNLLDLSRLKQLRKITPAVVDLRELLDKVLDDYSDLLTTKDITVSTNLIGNMQLEGDTEKLFRLFINLLDNSIRYNLAKKGQIKIKGRNKNGILVLELSNTGQPIPQSELELVFDQFYRVEKSRAISHGGTGLGLTIAKEIVDLHEGSIHITNEIEGFINVLISLPIKATRQIKHNGRIQ